MTALAATPDTDTYLGIAHDLGRRLADEAIWHEDRCNWLGVKLDSPETAGGKPEVVYGALGPDLYDGTSGVALFLAELYTATGDPALRRAALGAIRQALRGADGVVPPLRRGLYSGWLGIAYASARVATVLEDAALREQAGGLLARAARETLDEREHEHDLISGNAGAIAALVLLRDTLDDPALLEFAIRLGDGLLEVMHETGDVASWPTPAAPRQRHLTGFSHGVAGIGYALLELFAATGEPRYRRAAEGAFAYERRWFDAAAGNWPDFRDQVGHGRPGRGAATFAVYWCHGAPGIALSRLRAHAILGAPVYRDEAAAALRTTAAAARAILGTGCHDFSLCHGLAGLAEVLTHGDGVLGPAGAEAEQMVHQVAAHGQSAYARRGAAWPCGAGAGETPGLLIGLAGIGHFYLRLHAPAVPSVLLLARPASGAGAPAAGRPAASGVAS